MNMEMKKSFRINIRPLYKAITSGFESEPTKKEDGVNRERLIRLNSQAAPFVDSTIKSYMDSVYKDLLTEDSCADFNCEVGREKAEAVSLRLLSAPIPEDPYVCSYCKTAAFDSIGECLAHAATCTYNPREGLVLKHGLVRIRKENAHRRKRPASPISPTKRRIPEPLYQDIGTTISGTALLVPGRNSSTPLNDVSAINDVQTSLAGQNFQIDKSGECMVRFSTNQQEGEEHLASQTRHIITQEYYSVGPMCNPIQPHGSPHIRNSNTREVQKDAAINENRTIDNIAIFEDPQTEYRAEYLHPIQQNVSAVEPNDDEITWGYKYVKFNQYSVEVKREKVLKCYCPDIVPKCSDEECINRGLQIECGASCGTLCMNRRIQLHEWAPGLKMIMTETKGRGIFTTLPITKGEFLLEVCGEVIQKTEFEERQRTIYKDDVNHYCMNLEKGLVIDCRNMANEGRTINHSCDPNCEVQKWTAKGLTRVVIFSLRDIAQGEELTYDYKFSCFSKESAQPCYCGAESCRKYICPPKHTNPSSNE